MFYKRYKITTKIISAFLIFGASALPVSASAMPLKLALSRTCKAAKRSIHSYTEGNVGEVLSDMTTVEEVMDDQGSVMSESAGLDTDLLLNDMMAFDAQYDHTPRGRLLLRQFVRDNCFDVKSKVSAYPLVGLVDRTHKDQPGMVPVGHSGRLAGDVSMCPSLVEYIYLSGVFDQLGPKKTLAVGKAAGCVMAKAGTTVKVLRVIGDTEKFEEVQIIGKNAAKYWFDDVPGLLDPSR